MKNISFFFIPRSFAPRSFFVALILALFAFAPRIAHAQKNSLLWATYFGGNSNTFGEGMATDSSGNVYITGVTLSDSGIATQGAFKTMGDTTNGAAFLAKFSSVGKLLWATYFGANDGGEGVCVDKRVSQKSETPSFYSDTYLIQKSYIKV